MTGKMNSVVCLLTKPRNSALLCFLMKIPGEAIVSPGFFLFVGEGVVYKILAKYVRNPQKTGENLACVIDETAIFSLESIH